MVFFMIIRFDKEDDLFVIPTIVISKIDTKYVKTTNIHNCMASVFISVYLSELGYCEYKKRKK